MSSARLCFSCSGFLTARRPVALGLPSGGAEVAMRALAVQRTSVGLPGVRCGMAAGPRRCGRDRGLDVVLAELDAAVGAGAGLGGGGLALEVGAVAIGGAAGLALHREVGGGARIGGDRAVGAEPVEGAGHLPGLVVGHLVGAVAGAAEPGAEPRADGMDGGRDDVAGALLLLGDLVLVGLGRGLLVGEVRLDRRLDGVVGAGLGRRRRVRGVVAGGRRALGALRRRRVAGAHLLRRVGAGG